MGWVVVLGVVGGVFVGVDWLCQYCYYGVGY